MRNSNFLSALRRVARRVLGISQVEKRIDDFLDFLGTPEGHYLSEALRSAVEFDEDVLRLRTITGWSQNQSIAVLESRPESPKRLYEMIAEGHLIPTDGGQLITSTTYASADVLACQGQPPVLPRVVPNPSRDRVSIPHIPERPFLVDDVQIEGLSDQQGWITNAGLTVAEIETAWRDKLLPAPTTPCHSCQYHSTNGYLSCAVHPLGRPEGECGDWESR
jgi:hypothetical protein